MFSLSAMAIRREWIHTATVMNGGRSQITGSIQWTPGNLSPCSSRPPYITQVVSGWLQQDTCAINWQQHWHSALAGLVQQFAELLVVLNVFKREHTGPFVPHPTCKLSSGSPPLSGQLLAGAGVTVMLLFLLLWAIWMLHSWQTDCKPPAATGVPHLTSAYGVLAFTPA